MSVTVTRGEGSTIQELSRSHMNNNFNFISFAHHMMFGSCFIQCLEYRVGSVHDLFPGNCVGFFNVKRNQQTRGWGRTGLEPGTLRLQSRRFSCYAMGPPQILAITIWQPWASSPLSLILRYRIFLPGLHSAACSTRKTHYGNW